MKNKINILIVVVGIMAGGLSYWFNPYDEMSLLGISIYKLMGAGAFLGSLILTLILNEKPWKIAILITTGIIIGIMCRIIFDGIIDSSTHNLLPFEIIIALFISVPSAFIGSYLSQLIKYVKSKMTIANNV
tara:strand:+ start:115 stop:507 length:393 start_codon:yes stop_codon:yes gene_type:complete